MGKQHEKVYTTPEEDVGTKEAPDSSEEEPTTNLPLSDKAEV
jgi:hypothetical protein